MKKKCEITSDRTEVSVKGMCGFKLKEMRINAGIAEVFGLEPFDLVTKKSRWFGQVEIRMLIG